MIIFVTFVVILVSLIAQGLTLAPLVRFLHLDAATTVRSTKNSSRGGEPREPA